MRSFFCQVCEVCRARVFFLALGLMLANIGWAADALPTDTQLSEKLGWVAIPGNTPWQVAISDATQLYSVSVVGVNRTLPLGGYLVLSTSELPNRRLYIGAQGHVALESLPTLPQGQAEVPFPSLFPEVKGQASPAPNAAPLSSVDLSGLPQLVPAGQKLKTLSLAGFVYYNWFGYHSRYTGEAIQLHALGPLAADQMFSPSGAVSAPLMLVKDFSLGFAQDSHPATGVHTYWDAAHHAYIFAIEENPLNYEDLSHEDTFNMLILSVRVGERNYPAFLSTKPAQPAAK